MMPADDLRRDRAAEGESEKDGWEVLRADGVVVLRRSYSIHYYTSNRRPSAALAVAAVIPQQDVEAAVEKVRH